MSQRHWLLALDGMKGMAFFVGAVSLVAPSLLAYYLLSPAELLRAPWPLTLLLSISVGGAVSTILIGFSKSIVSIRELFDIEDRDEANHLVASSVAGSYSIQALAIALCFIWRESFRTYVITAVSIAIFVPMMTRLLLRFLRWRMKKKAAKHP